MCRTNLFIFQDLVLIYDFVGLSQFLEVKSRQCANLIYRVNGYSKNSVIGLPSEEH